MNFQGVELTPDMIWTSAVLALITCVWVGVKSWRSLDDPPSFFERWADHAKKRDGQGFVFGAVVLIAASGAGLMSFLMGFVPSKGVALFIALVPVVFSWVVMWDMWKFWQAERKSTKQGDRRHAAQDK